MTYIVTAAGVCCAVGLNIATVVGPSIVPVPSDSTQQVVSSRTENSAVASPTMWVLLASGLALVSYAGRDRKRDNHP